MPGIGLEMEGAIQHAPQWGRQSMTVTLDEIAAEPLLCISTFEAQSD
jgi:hypothetical protein